MNRKRTIDLAIIILCALIILVALYGLNTPGGLYIATGAATGLIALLILYLMTVLAQRKGAGTATPPSQPAAGGGAITELLLLNEEEHAVAAWDMFSKTSLVIGKDIKENHVDINLNQSVYASMIDIEHAVLNYAGGQWYIEDLGSKNGLVLQKQIDGRKYKLAAGQPCQLDQGDIIIIGLTKLLAR